jgi:hypothetical protein
VVGIGITTPCQRLDSFRFPAKMPKESIHPDSIPRFVPTLQISRLKKTKNPGLTFADSSEGLDEQIMKLMFIEIGEIEGGVKDAEQLRAEAWKKLLHCSRKRFTDEISNTAKWGPSFDVWNEIGDTTLLRGLRAAEIRETYGVELCPKCSNPSQTRRLLATSSRRQGPSCSW